jgi:hypothetical protein
MAKIKIGCGWYVLAILGAGTWAANKWAPNHIARAKAAAWAKVPKMPWQRGASATPSPAPTPQLATPAPESTTPSPSPEPTAALLAPETTPEPTPDTSVSSDTVTTEDLRMGAGKKVALGNTVRIRCAKLGDGGENLGGSSDFLFMVGADEVAPGLDQAVLGMKSGGKRRTRIPAELTKGTLPSGVEVGEGTLSCEIELAEVL